MKDQLIQQVVDRGIATSEEALQEYNRFVEDAEKQFEFLQPEQRLQRAEIMFANYFKALAKTDLRTFEGVILRASGKDFITRKRIEKIMREYNENPQQVILDGKVKLENGQPVAIESKKYFNEGKPNQKENRNFGKPLNENSVQRTLEGVFMFDGQEKKFVLTMRDDSVYNLKVPLLQLVRMKVSVGQSINQDTLRLIVKRGSKFEAIPDKSINVTELIEKHYKDDLIEISQIEEVVSTSTDTFGLKKMIKGQVMELNLQPNEKGFGGCRLMTESLDMEQNSDCRIRIPEDWLDTIDFGEFSTVYVYGNPWVFTAENKNKIVGMTALGIYPVVKTQPSDPVIGAKESDIKINSTSNKEFADFNSIDNEAFSQPGATEFLG